MSNCLCTTPVLLQSYCSSQEIWRFSLFLLNPPFYLFGMRPSKKNFPKNEGNPDRKEAENTMLTLSRGPSLSPSTEAEKHFPRTLVPRHQEHCLFLSPWLACSAPDFLPVLWPYSHQGSCCFLALQKLICCLVP